MKAKKKDNRGGSGRGQGRKSTYGEATEQLRISVPKSKKDYLMNMLLKELKKFEVKKQ